MINRNADRMQYQSDKLSYWLCVLGIVFNMVYFVAVYTNRSIVPDVTIGADVIINIIFMMVVFMASEKLKAYSKHWNVYAILAGAVQFFRTLWLPNHYKQLEMLIEKKYTFVIACLIISGSLLILAGINATINGRILNTLDENNGVGG